LFATHLREYFIPLAKKLFPVLLDVIGCGNKVISGYVNEACEILVEHTHIKTGIPKLCTSIRTSRSKLLRERCASYLLVALNTWDKSEIERFERHIVSALKTGMADASAETRAKTRDCFHAYASKFEESASSLVKYLDSRTQRLLMESASSKPYAGTVRKKKVATRNGNGSNKVRYNSHRDSLEDNDDDDDNESENKGWSYSNARPLKVTVPRDTEVHRSPKYSPIRLNVDSSPKRADILKPSPVYAERIRQFSGGNSDDNSKRNRYGGDLDPPKPRRRSVSAPAFPDDVGTVRFTLGEPVLVSTRFGNYIGAVRYCGRPVDFAEGEWIGVEFEEPVGKNNGSVQGVEYFRCRHNHGLFVRPNQIRPYFETGSSSTSNSSHSKRLAKSPPRTTVTTSTTAKIKDCRSLGQDLLETHRAHIDNVLEALKIEMEELAIFEEQINRCDESGRSLTETSFRSYMTTVSKRLDRRNRLHVSLRDKMARSEKKINML